MATSNTPANDAAGLGQFRQAMELIDDEDKVEYLEAQRRCHPQVWEQEANPRLFLARDDGDPWRAARRMVDYWRGRVGLFGDRAYYPLMAAKGTERLPSALTEVDQAFMETGHGALLPPNRNGDSIIFMDHSKLTTPDLVYATMSRIRLFFYLMHKALIENESPTAYKVHILASVCKPPASGYDFKFSGRFLQLPDFMPITIAAIDLAAVQPSVSGRGRVLRFLSMQTAFNMVGNYYEKKMNFYYGSAESSTHEDDQDFMVTPLLRELKGAGFRRNGLPECMGGSFTNQSWRQWLAKQRRRELQLYITKEDRLTKTRELNRHHSRLKRQRRSQEFNQLQEQVETLKKQREAITGANHELEQLLGKAQEVLRQQTAPGDMFDTVSSVKAVQDSISCPNGVELSEQRETVTSGMALPMPSSLNLPFLLQVPSTCHDRCPAACSQQTRTERTDTTSKTPLVHTDSSRHRPLPVSIGESKRSWPSVQQQAIDDARLFYIFASLMDEQGSEDDRQCSRLTLEPVPLAEIFPFK